MIFYDRLMNLSDFIDYGVDVIVFFLVKDKLPKLRQKRPFCDICPKPPVNTSQGGFQKSDPGFCHHGFKSKCPIRQFMLRQIIHNFSSYVKNQRAFIATKLNFRRNKNNKSDFEFFKVRFGFHAEIVFKNQVGYSKIRFRIFFYRNKNKKSCTDFQKTNVNF